MKRSKTIDDKLDELLKGFNELLGDCESDELDNDEKNIERLMRFGFTPTEAKAWLRNEPNYSSSDVGYHDDPNRRKVTRTLSWILLPLCLFFLLVTFRLL